MRRDPIGADTGVKSVPILFSKTAVNIAHFALNISDILPLGT
jgi:hypothetical protein